MSNQVLPLSKRVAKSIGSAAEAAEWERLIITLLQRLELAAEEKARAEEAYRALAQQIASNLRISQQDIEVFPQGSMRTQTTVSPRGNTKFDLDVVVRFGGTLPSDRDPEAFFAQFGDALRGNENVTGKPVPKRRCWRLQYPHEPFYFDVTPALPAAGYLEAPLRVRDPETRWSPSNPIEYANWFCDRAARRFPFQQNVRKAVLDARAAVEPLPSETVGIDDILRRTVQLFKLHRDNFYWFAEEAKKEIQPISVIIVTLATRAYETLFLTRQHEFASAIELAMAVVENMPRFVETRGGRYWVTNPALPSENFADRWNSDEGLRSNEFLRWHSKLEADLEMLFAGPKTTLEEERLRPVFGSAAVDIWKGMRPMQSGVLAGLVASAPGGDKSNPTSPVRVGSRGTLA